MSESVPALRQQLQQLNERLTRGDISASKHAPLKAKLERQLLDAVLADPAGTPVPALAPRPSTRMVALLSAAVVAIAGGGYAVTGSPGLPSAGAPGAVVAAPEGGGGAANAEEFAAVVERLAQKLKDQPDNPDGWAMLARSYARLSRPAEALTAFAKAVALKGDDPQLLADYADLMAFQNNRTLAGEPTLLIERALKLDPNHPKALALAGSAAFDRKDFTAAVRHWELLAGLSPPGSEFLTQLQSGIDEARKLGGLPPAAAAAPAAAPVVAAAAAVAAPAAPVASAAGPAASTGAKVTGTVRLAPALAAQVSPEDTVFVLARPADGSRMPLAVSRHRVKDLPLQFSLDDSMAMAPTARLSLFERVVVVARISKTGQAMSAAGDITGQSAPVPNSARDLVIEINAVVKN
jgi:cytochrome c-type biogenesis protein CcmH